MSYPIKVVIVGCVIFVFKVINTKMDFSQENLISGLEDIDLGAVVCCRLTTTPAPPLIKEGSSGLKNVFYFFATKALRH